MMASFRPLRLKKTPRFATPPPPLKVLSWSFAILRRTSESSEVAKGAVQRTEFV